MSAILLAAQEYPKNIDKHKDPLLQLDQHIDFRAIATEVDHL